jgi:DNA-binding IclR family transcriptional regulator
VLAAFLGAISANVDGSGEDGMSGPDAAANDRMSDDDDGVGAAKNTVKPVVNAVRILRYLSQSGKPARTTQVARVLSINTSTCFNILRTLVGEGVVEFDTVSKTYRPGMGLLKLVGNSLREGQRLEMARPVMHALAERFSVTATLWRRIGDDRIVLVAVEHSPSDLRIHMTTGQRLPFLMGATGRLVAADLDLGKSEAAAGFRSLRWARPITFEAYWKELQQAKERGWAIDDGYFSHGIMTVAVPVYDTTGAMAFSLSSVMFRGQYDEAGVEKLGQEMKRLSPRLTDLLY